MYDFLKNTTIPTIIPVRIMVTKDRKETLVTSITTKQVVAKADEKDSSVKNEFVSFTSLEIPSFV